MRSKFVALLFVAIVGLPIRRILRIPSGEVRAQTNAADAQQETDPRADNGQYLDIDGSKIYYQECGTGPSIVLLHDGLLHSITWDGVWPTLCAKFHVLRYDRRGYGRSDPAKARYSPTEDLRNLLQHLKIEHAIIVGNSSGASVAIDFALAHPEQVDALMLIGPVVDGMGFTDQFEARAERNSSPLKAGDAKGAAENWSKDVYLFGPGQEAVRKKFYDSLIQNPQDLTHSSKFEIWNFSAATSLSEIHVPTVILVGESDIPDVHAHAGAIEAGIPGARRDIIEGAGHLIQVEKPDEVATRLTSFAERVERKAASVPAKELDSYVGQYTANGVPFTVSAVGGAVLTMKAGLFYFVLYPESDSKFFMKTEPLEIEFAKDADGKVTQMMFESDKGDVLQKFSKM